MLKQEEFKYNKRAQHHATLHNSTNIVKIKIQQIISTTQPQNLFMQTKKRPQH